MESTVATLQAVRAFFGLRQRELAPWLGLSLSQLSNVEAGLKPLPRHATPWLRAWLPALAAGHAAEAAGPPGPPRPAALPETEPDPCPAPASGPAAVLARWAECLQQAQRLARRQAALRAGHRLAARRQAAGPLLQAALPPPPGPAAPAEATALAVRRRWLARWLAEAADDLAAEAAAGPVAVLLLEGRRRAWLHEAAWLGAFNDTSPP